MTDPQARLPGLASTVAGFELLGRTHDARKLAAELVGRIADRPAEQGIAVGFDFAYTRTAVEFEPELREALKNAPQRPWTTLALTCFDRDFVRAAEMWAGAGSPTWEARLRLRAAEELIENGRRVEAEEQAQKALTFYRSVGATFFLDRGEALLAEAKTA